MIKKKGSILRFALNEPRLLEQIATRIPSYEGQKWRLPSNRTPLEVLAGKEPTAALYELEKKDSVQANVLLRDLLIGPLRSKDMNLRLAAIEWVIYEWGGIPDEENSSTHKLWPKQFQNYEPEIIKEFIENNYEKRIASWSKALAFADSKRYPIYDARVAMSLNWILDDIGYKNRFYCPPPSANRLKPNFSHIKAYAATLRKRPIYIGYLDYMEMAVAIVEKGMADSVLDVEMRLFAYGKLYANSYAEKHGLEIPYPKLKKQKPAT